MRSKCVILKKWPDRCLGCVKFSFDKVEILPWCSLTEIPTVEDSKMGADMAVLRDEANEFDVIHDVVLEVKFSYFCGARTLSLVD